ncbi:hypothetical protein ACFL2Q_01450 [Thermodesulfobacteriota bacterium]
MRRAISLLVAVLIFGVVPAWAQQAQMYDQQYRGPVNYYGQPTYKPVPRPRQPSPNPYMTPQAYGAPQQRRQAQQPQIQNGVVPYVSNYLHGYGQYFWSFLPAPIRGQQPQTQYQSGPGHVSVTLVPGSPPR